jgi:hypothetical protein
MVYPNPANNIVYFDLKDNYYNIEIYNLSGQKITRLDSNDNNLITFDTKDITSEMYFYSITGKSGKLASDKLLIEK